MRKITSPIDVYGIEFCTYRKRPIEVSAAFMSEPFEVETTEGRMLGDAGDYLIIGVNGELYPCKKDVFIKTYKKSYG